MTDPAPTLPPPAPITIPQLDQLADFVINPKPTSPLATAVAAFKLVVVCAYLWARWRLQDDDKARQAAQQAYEQAQTTDAKTEVASEDAFDKEHP